MRLDDAGAQCVLRRRFIRRLLFILAGMVTMGQACCTTSTRGASERDRDTFPLRPLRHRANMANMGGDTPPSRPPAEVAANRRRAARRAQPAHAHATGAAERTWSGEETGRPEKA
jgi:hypothetical protein